MIYTNGQTVKTARTSALPLLISYFPPLAARYERSIPMARKIHRRSRVRALERRLMS